MVLAALWWWSPSALWAHNFYIAGFAVLYSGTFYESVDGLVEVARARGSQISEDVCFIIGQWAFGGVFLALAVDSFLLWLGIDLSREEAGVFVTLAGVGGSVIGYRKSYPQEPKPATPEKEPFQLPKYARMPLRKF